MKKQDVKPFAWGFAVGAIALLIVIFSAGWVVTSGSAKEIVKASASTAVMDRLGPIAVAQFMKDPNKDTRLQELKALDYWKRGTFVKDQGWATMPGEEKSDSSVADDCARRLMELKG